jgi:hypothetical protein
LLIYQESEQHKGDMFTKRLDPAKFERAMFELLGMTRGVL